MSVERRTVCHKDRNLRVSKPKMFNVYDFIRFTIYQTFRAGLDLTCSLFWGLNYDDFLKPSLEDPDESQKGMCRKIPGDCE